ncbi:hypothetical protein As57867_006987, partial [Aphanomyces stellatus]
MATHAVDIQCQVPVPWMICALKLTKMLPIEEMKAVSEDTIRTEKRIKAEEFVGRDLALFQKRCERHAKYAFLVTVEGPDDEEEACKALEEDMASLRKWREKTENATNDFLVNYRSEVGSMVKEAIDTLGQPKDENILTAFWKYLTHKSSTPFLKNQSIRALVPQLYTRLKEAYDKWLTLFQQHLSDDVMDYLVQEEFKKQVKGLNIPAIVKNKRDGIVHTAFKSLVAEHDATECLRVTLYQTRYSEYRCTREDFTEDVQYVKLHDVSQTSSVFRQTLYLPATAEILHLSRFHDLTVVVYVQDSNVKATSFVQESTESLKETIVKVYKKSDQLLTRSFPKATLLCSFTPDHRLLALLHSDTKVDFFAFHESYRALERAHETVDVSSPGLRTPVHQLVVFGGANHGIALLDSVGQLQCYYVRTKQMPQLTEHGLQ